MTWKIWMRWMVQKGPGTFMFSLPSPVSRLSYYIISSIYPPPSLYPSAGPSLSHFPSPYICLSDHFLSAVPPLTVPLSHLHLPIALILRPRTAAIEHHMHIVHLVAATHLVASKIGPKYSYPTYFGYPMVGLLLITMLFGRRRSRS